MTEELKRYVAMRPSIEGEYLYTAGETAELLRISKRTLERWRGDGRGPTVTRLWRGGRPLYKGSDIRKFVGFDDA
jgi:hypothetical protein